jgi:hypothetical protein
LQVAAYVRECGHEEASRILERRAITGSALKALTERDLEAIGVPARSCPEILRLIHAV